VTPVAGPPEAGIRALPAPEVWAVGDVRLDLAEPRIMGILNVTPDSFSDGGSFGDAAAAVRRAAAMLEEGAAILDVGGESTRPGARTVPAAEEIDRVVPVIRGIRAMGIAVPISIDTRKTEVAEAALAAGANIVNDVSALGDPGMGSVVARHGAGLVLMHMRGTPETMQDDPVYEDVVEQVAAHLGDRLERARMDGVAFERVVLDPGIGFGKTAEHNLALIRNLPRLAALGRPVMLGASRKAFLGRILGGAAPDARLHATIGACVAGLFFGARIFRVHDVRPVAEALRVAEAVRVAGGDA
jgi:dihydropteroate synthase